MSKFLFALIEIGLKKFILVFVVFQGTKVTCIPPSFKSFTTSNISSPIMVVEDYVEAGRF
jgi:hypothetical protein